MKPKVLLVSDSAFIDTGFGRVAREIGTGLVKAGFSVTQLGWFHRPNDKFVPFRVIPTSFDNPLVGAEDAYGQITYDHVVQQVQPDLVLCIGDEWMVSHMATKPRNHLMVGYVPIDSHPIMHKWLQTFANFDRLVVYGDYAEKVIRDMMPKFQMSKIPHGVDTETFQPLQPEQRIAAREMITGGKDRFIVGCVARNNVRKQIPRLLQAFSRFIQPWIACDQCGKITYAEKAGELVGAGCDVCPGHLKAHGPGKPEALLYLHCALEDPAGHKLASLIDRHGLHGNIAMPQNYQIGNGVPDWQLNVLYNAMDLFTLPTSGEGWGLPIIEAMAAGTPVLVTDYSGHVDFVKGVGEFISVADWYVEPTNNCDRALVDIDDYVMKLDRFYYEREDFIRKWGGWLERGGVDTSHLDRMDFGKKLREGMGRMCHERAQQYQWQPIVQQWVGLVKSLLQINGRLTKQDQPKTLEVTVL